MAEKYLTTLDASTAIDEVIEALKADRVILVTDSNVDKIVLPFLKNSRIVETAAKAVINPGENSKNLDTVAYIWDKMESAGATRNSVVLNIGGGMVTDIGGFAAATFKRGVRTVNLPTTLLGAVDAASGGKTGFNFRGLKNEIGAFHLPEKVIISALPFSSLSHEEKLSGYAEMIKTALISDKKFYYLLSDYESIINDVHKLGKAVEQCVAFKEEVVEEDPKEKGLRKILNFGHTAGHAFESLRIESGSPVTHGCAVAHGMLVALILSHIKLEFDSGEINQYAKFLKEYYGPSLIRCNDLEKVMEKMNSDKKNRRYGEPSFTLLKEIGVPEINIIPSQSEVKEALELYLDMNY